MEIAQEIDTLEIIIDKNSSGERLDSFVLNYLSGFRKARVQQLITQGKINVNGKLSSFKQILQERDIVQIRVEPPYELDIIPENIPIEIVYEDEDFLIINKPSGLVVHPTCCNWQGTLLNALYYYSENHALKKFTPYIIHRLDKNTSGLLIVSKNKKTQRFFHSQLLRREINRKYIALVHGVMDNDEGCINLPLMKIKKDKYYFMEVNKNGKESISYWKVLERFEEFTLVELKLGTGRSHQLRVHLSYIGHPIVGEDRYTEKQEPHLNRYFLHAYKIKFTHPTTKNEIEFEIDLPEQLDNIINLLREFGTIPGF